MTETRRRLSYGPLALTVAGGIGIVLAFASTVAGFGSFEATGTKSKLIGADAELGYPSSAVAMVLFVIVVTIAAAALAGATIGRGWWNALVALLSIGVVFEIWATYLMLVAHIDFNWLIVIQLIIMIALLTVTLRQMPFERPSALGVFLVVASTVGFFAAFRLTVDKVGLYVNPTVAPSCNVSFLVQCGVNLRSKEGSLFGFPNPLLGVGGWAALLMIGILVVSGMSFARWFWIAMNIGVAAALALVIWLISVSIFTLFTLCPWCMVTWAAVIPSFLAITLRNLSNDTFRVAPRARQFFSAAYGFVPVITLVCYVVVALIAQGRLDVIHRL